MWKGKEERKEKRKQRELANAVPKEEEENERYTSKKEEKELQMPYRQKEIKNWEWWKRKPEIKHSKWERREIGAKAISKLKRVLLNRGLATWVLQWSKLTHVGVLSHWYPSSLSATFCCPSVCFFSFPPSSRTVFYSWFSGSRVYRLFLFFWGHSSWELVQLWEGQVYEGTQTMPGDPIGKKTAPSCKMLIPWECWSLVGIPWQGC